ncbi:hypothetical protein Cni_G28232 [Canna indica]|uniref:Uncharacterized protein n=1 Tax=Canna indica TaxID=4628 RepID=A0AAQ3L330_9LILI|nr:hypothetical protein Cni_G28232 [Canna indica]
MTCTTMKHPDQINKAEQEQVPSETRLRINDHIMGKLNKIKSDDLHPKGGSVATIFRVPQNILGTDENAYKPKIVSLGPYHHQRLGAGGDGAYLKLTFVNKFLARKFITSDSKYVEDCLKHIEANECRVRKAYSELVDMDSDMFKEMMLLDCCFVLELLFEFNDQKKKKAEEEKGRTEERRRKKEDECIINYCCGVLFSRNIAQQHPYVSKEDPTIIPEETKIEAGIIPKWALPLVLHDIFMLENQLPFFLLEKLFEIADVKDVLMEDLILLITKDIVKGRIGKCKHLLQLFHSCIRPTTNGTEQEDDGDYNDVVLAFFKEQEQEQVHLVPCARELQEAKVKLVKRKTNSLLDITFHKASIFDITSFWSGRLEIPRLVIDDGTNTLLRNLIAFEQCYPNASDHVTTFACFMDSVIDTNMDVALLRQGDIIVNGLGCDEDVALLFNKLCKDVVIDLSSCYLSGVIKDIKKHCDWKCNKCCASLKHTYFSNPWAYFSVIAAVILFALTLIQTVYTILSYNKQ